MYKIIIMLVDVFEMVLSDKVVWYVEFLVQQDGVIYLFYVLLGFVSFIMSCFIVDLWWFEEYLQYEVEICLQMMVSYFSIDLFCIKLYVCFGSVCDMVNELVSEINVDVVVIGLCNFFISIYLFGFNVLSVICYVYILVMVVR